MQVIAGVLCTPSPLEAESPPPGGGLWYGFTYWSQFRDGVRTATQIYIAANSEAQGLLRLLTLLNRWNRPNENKEEEGWRYWT